MMTKLGVRDFNAKMKELSGGQRKRVAMAAVLSAGADFLILDEPTNHMDVYTMEGLEKLLAAQTGERALGLCERQGVFLCRTARSGHVVAFCTQSVSQEGTIVTLQASAGFAARAALARPPFVSALEWMGSPLLPLDDLPLACRLLTALGAQRVLVVAPQSALRHQPDALEQANGFFVPCARELGENVGVFRIPLPETLGALSLDRILPAMDVGREAAEHGMEAALERIGMPLCRVLPFRRRLIAP